MKATAESNININWVATRKSGHVESKAQKREIELLKYALLQHNLTGRTKTLDLILGAGIKDYLANFAGVGWDFIEAQTKDISAFRAMIRLCKEIAFSGFALRDMGKLKRQLKKKPLDSLKKLLMP